MVAVNEVLQLAFLDALGEAVIWHSDESMKPLCIDLRPPSPRKLRCYLYSLVDGGARRQNEFKAVLRVRGQRVGEYGRFDSSGGRLALVLAYRRELDVFVIWDAALHPQFKNGGNIQVRDQTVYTAAAIGRSHQTRTLSGATELVIACQSHNLLQAIEDRVAWTGDVSGEEWATSLS